MRESTGERPVRIIVLPDAEWVDRSDVITTIEDHGHRILDVSAPMESKAVCAALIDADVAPPLVVIAHGDACRILPAVALSLRTQHRDTAGYVLVDPDAPPSTDTWPEAPVTVVSTYDEDGTSLRGWQVVSAASGLAATVAQVASRIVDG